MAQFIIIGSGFGGLTAVRELRRRAPDAEIRLVAPKPEFIYYPSLIWVPTGLRQGEELRIDLRDFFQRQRVEFVADTVQSIDAQGHVQLESGTSLEQDALIIAAGGRGLRKLPGIEHSLAICDGIETAQQIRERLQSMAGGNIAFGFAGNPQEPSAVRGGPIFELLFGIDTYLRRQGTREKFTLTFFNPMREPGNRLGADAVAGLLAEMERRQIRTHLGHKITGFDAQQVHTEGGDIDADLILFMPGMTGPAFAANSALPLSPGGFLQADNHCQVPGLPGVYAVGDAASYGDSPNWLPKQGHSADLQAKTAVHNALRHVQGQAADQTFRQELICIVDSLDGGNLVYRSPNTARVVPGSWWHLAKRVFEWRYLASYRPRSTG
ncbi:MAG: FAD-dependent oxidoreductase [Acidithiobacillus sp.]|nr:FAD-dependent oxidoreductase [Acidithiobacillus sp.]